MTTLDPEPFGKPTLLLGSNSILDATETTAFVSTGLLDAVFDGNGDGGEGEDAFSAQSPPCATLSDVDGFSSDNQQSEFMSNGLLDSSTQTTSTVIPFLIASMVHLSLVSYDQVRHPRRFSACWAATFPIRKL